jgi:hypothetical protein
MAVVQGLRDFLEVLETNGQLLRIPEEVSLEPDIGAAGRAITQIGETSPALSFEKIKGYENARIVLNVHGSWPNHALLMGMPKDSDTRAQFFEFVKRYQQFPGKIERVTDAPWMENVIDKDVNLFDIMPLFRLNRCDGGFYIDKSCIVSRDPDDFENDDVQNVGIYRLEVKGPNRIGIQPVPEHDIAIHLAHAEERGEDLPIYITLGASPLMEIVAGMPILYNQSEYKMLSALQGVRPRCPAGRGICPARADPVPGARGGGPFRRIHRKLFGRTFNAGRRDRQGLPSNKPHFRDALYRPTVDRGRFLGGHQHMRAALRAAERGLPGGRRSQCNVYAWARCHRLHEAAHGRLCPRRRHAVHDDASWIGLRKDRDHGR